jgi:hypothetical protein
MGLPLLAAFVAPDAMPVLVGPFLAGAGGAEEAIKGGGGREAG